MAQKLIIDADPGIADALALLTALADPAVDVLALTAVAGTVSGVQATRNLQYLTATADPLRHPRIGQSEMAVAPSDAVPTDVPSQYILNGRFGLGDVEPAAPDLHNRRESAKLIVDLVREFPYEVSLLCLGPLTNVAMAFDLEPQLPELLDSIVILGGAFSAGGDVTAAAEFNIWADPGAAAAVLDTHVRKKLVPIDVSNQSLMNFDDIDRLSGLIPSAPAGEMICSMLHFAVRTSRQHLPKESIPLPAAVALAVATGQGAIGIDAALVQVELQGMLTTGMTILEQRPIRNRLANCELVTSVDLPAVFDYVCRGLRRIVT